MKKKKKFPEWVMIKSTKNPGGVNFKKKKKNQYTQHGWYNFFFWKSPTTTEVYKSFGNLISR